MTIVEQKKTVRQWHDLTAAGVATELGVAPEQGLDPGAVERRLGEYEPNELPKELPPSVWEVARGQLSNPMNIMLLIVSVASFAIGQIPTGVFVLGLVTFNVVMPRLGAEGARQRRSARAAAGAARARPARRHGRRSRIDAAGSGRHRAA